MNSSRSDSSNFVIVAVSQVISIFVLFWMNQYLLNRLTPEQYAPYPVVLSALALLQLLEAFAAGGVARFVTEAQARDGDVAVRETVSSALPVTVTAGLLVLAMASLLSLFLDDVFTLSSGSVGTTRVMLLLLASNLALSLALLPFSVGLFVRRRFLAISVLSTARDLLRAGLIVAFLLLLEPAVYLVVVATVTAALVHLAANLLLSLRALPGLRFSRRSFDPSISRSLLGFGVWSMVGALVQRSRQILDVFLLNRMATAADVSLFYVGTLPVQLQERVLASSLRVIQPTLIGLSAEGDRDALARWMLSAGRYNLWIVLGPSLLMILLARPFFELYLDRSPQVPAIVLALVSGQFLFRGSTEVLYHICVAMNRIGRLFSLASLALVLHVVLVTVALRVSGEGAIALAVASLAAVLVSHLVLYWPFACRLLDIRPVTLARSLLPGWGPCLVTAAIAVPLLADSMPTSWWSLCAAATWIGGLYLGLVAAFAWLWDRERFLGLLGQLRAAVTRRSR